MHFVGLKFFYEPNQVSESFPRILSGLTHSPDCEGNITEYLSPSTQNN